MNILITGSASHLAKTCIPVLLDDSRIDKLIGIDLLPSSISHPGFEEHIMDIRSDQLAQYFSNIDAVIHLAFIVDNGLLGTRRFDREYIRDVNVIGSQNVFKLAETNQIKNIIHVSSAIVYGMSQDTPQFIDEAQPLKTVEGFYYSEDKVALEKWLDDFEKQHSDMRIVRLRPHIVLGQYAQPHLKTVLNQPFHFMFPDPQPLIQCISEVDVATAIQNALFSDTSGSFNLATDQVSSFHWIHKHLHNFSLPLPFSVASSAHRLAWKYSTRFGDPAWLECMRYPLTLANDKAKQELDWQPTLDLFQCLEATV